MEIMNANQNALLMNVSLPIDRMYAMLKYVQGLTDGGTVLKNGLL
jgi:hypothetical protein